MKHIEIECKWNGNTPRAFERAKRFVLKHATQIFVERVDIEDAYLDHAANDLSAQKIAFRLRNTDGKWEATYKTRTRIINGKATRREETLALSTVKNLTEALETLSRKKIWKGIDLRELKVKFLLSNRRTVYTFSYNGGTLEMVLDNVILHILGRQVKFKEIEVELKRGNDSVLNTFASVFANETQLKTVKNSKVKTAEVLLDLWKN
ncbi:MAG: CYTH domain-containing protein [Elusimicrobiaceae bacterium]|nr:CYTH domain-containing protein [Elusimicrobiaceae bacterium]